MSDKKLILENSLNIFTNPSRIVWAIRDILVFLFVSYIAIASITEISARDSFLANLSNQIQSTNAQLAQNTGADNNLTEEGIVTQRKALANKERLKIRLESLISVGADKDIHKLEEIREEFENISIKSINSSSDNDSEQFSSFEYLFLFQKYIKSLSSDVLLGITIMTCGAIGAGVGALRTHETLTTRNVVFGLSAGFIMFLIIKGGVHVFIFRESSQVIQFNPYSCGFSGLLAGMFTEKVFNALSMLSDSVFDQLEKVVGKNQPSA